MATTIKNTLERPETKRAHKTSSEQIVEPITISDFHQSVRRHLRYSLAKTEQNSTARDRFMSAAMAVQDLIIDRMLKTEQRYTENNVKRMYYLSMEFLMGRSLGNNLCNLGIYDLCKDALIQMGIDLEETLDFERDAALGNGGLGRLAACFLDSLATLGMPGFGYGINYEYGLFRQEIDNGHQREKPDHWSNAETPWLIDRLDEACIIPVYGRLEHAVDREGSYNPMWMDWKILIGVPHDMPIVGYGGKTVNFLRLFSARSSNNFDMQIFNQGDYFKAVEQKISSENISKVLYPTDTFESGKELRLVQEYFLVACSVRNILRKFRSTNSDFSQFSSKIAIHLNDTHPALTVAELMRTFVDEEGISWDIAWKITKETIGYTNHTLMPEALEKWSVPLMEHVLPRHLQIIQEINHRHLKAVEKIWPGDKQRQQNLSIIEEGTPKIIRMANLSIVGSHSVNGVARLHSKLVKSSLVPDFYELWPERFNNKTNGITQRRWVLKANPSLARLIESVCGKSWVTDLYKLRQLENYSDDTSFRNQFSNIKKENKQRLANWVNSELRVKIDPNSLFDVQVKRIHEYKRQLLNVMHIIYKYLLITEDNYQPQVPRTFIFAGKAAPGYWAAKQIIKLICNVGKVINSDPRTSEMLRVIFIPDYRVSLAELIIPAADLSEQISTAGMEASGTGNMKLMVNGALTIGTHDGANIEIREEAGDENIFIFGLTSEEIETKRHEQSYHPWEYYNQNPSIHRVMDALKSSLFELGEANIFLDIFNRILNQGDHYFHLADFETYLQAHDAVDNDYIQPHTWTRKAIMNVARAGKFSSDRTIAEYARDIWNIKPIL